MITPPRILIHIPVGWLNVAFLRAHPPLGVLFGIGFLAYELTQSRSADFKDKGHKDILSYLYGLGTGGTIWLVLKLWLWASKIKEA